MAIYQLISTINNNSGRLVVFVLLLTIRDDKASAAVVLYSVYNATVAQLAISRPVINAGMQF